METQKIKLTLIEPDPNQPRKVKPEDYLRELGESIKAEGLQSPITIRVHPKKAGHFMVVFGECRYHASVMAGLETIEAFVREYDDDKDVFISQLVENITRLNMTPMEEAEGYKRAILMGADIEYVAGKAGKSVSTVAADIELCGLPPFVKKMIDTGEIPKAVARELAKMPDNKVGTALKWAMEKPQNVKTMLAQIDAYRQADGQFVIGLVDYKAPIDKTDPNVVKAGKAWDALQKNMGKFLQHYGNGKLPNVIKAKKRNLEHMALEVKELQKVADRLMAEIIKAQSQLPVKKAA